MTIAAPPQKNKLTFEANCACCYNELMRGVSPQELRGTFSSIVITAAQARIKSCDRPGGSRAAGNGVKA